MIRAFIDIVYTSIQESRDGDQWRAMVAYQLLIVSKEDIGVERSLGGVFYSLGQFSKYKHYLWYQEKRAVGVANFAASKKFSEIVQVNYDRMEKKQSSNFSQYIVNMRGEINRNNVTFTAASLIMSSWWFDNMTLMVDIMFNTQNKLVRQI